ncbi:MAG: hypothetical protein M3M88_05585 [Thermoproteota archaeon]|nr:hypothetical protein [Thermoproteota archaeon]
MGKWSLGLSLAIWIRLYGVAIAVWFLYHLELDSKSALRVYNNAAKIK